MKHYKIYKQFLLIFILVLNINIINAQDNTPESKTVKVKKDVICQIDFTTVVDAEISTPKNSTEYYDISPTNGGKAIQIQTKQESLPPTLLIVKETNGKIWNISLEYKADLDPDNEAETNLDFADNTTDSKKGNNIILTPTIGGLKLKVQDKSIPYDTPEELDHFRKSYPDFKFNLIPPEQTINLADTENDRSFNENLYIKRPNVNLAFRSDEIKIKLVCQNVEYKGTNGYLKLLIQNETEQEFLTGNMILSVVRQNGSSLKLHPGYIFPNQFPVIKPGYQMAIIYAFKAYDIADEDSLKFEIHDRQQKINLEFNIAGVEYNKLAKE